MTVKEAQDVLIALACCSMEKLACSDCPLEGENDTCDAWTDEDVAEAVRTLQGTRAENKCAVCGNVIPEGRQICPRCEKQR